MASSMEKYKPMRVQKSDTVKQTIVETIKAPHLTEISTANFVLFKQKREIYEHVIAEKNADANVQITLTTYRNSIPKPILQLFVFADWFFVSNMEEITKEHLRRASPSMLASTPQTMIWPALSAS
eukprot:IDg19448t1